MTLALSPADRARLVDFANLAPSVHNTQPARWHFAGDGAIWILADPARYLPVGDPTRRDAGLSCGAALEATMLGLASFGLEADGIDILWGRSASPIPGREAAARLTLRQGNPAVPLADQMPHRFTWRRAFAPARNDAARDLGTWAGTQSDLTLVTGAAGIAQMSDFNDPASLGFLRNRAFRAELLSWMRLRPADPRWNEDGLSAAALGMTGIEALGAGIVLRPPVFEALDKLGFGKAIVSEQPKTVTATAIGLFHRPADESPVTTGRAYLTTMLNLARLGFQTWPMTAIADDAEIAAEASRLHSLPAGHRLVSVLRIGAVPDGANPARARLTADRLATSQQL